MYTDNVYIDTTWSRVELVDNPSYLASRVRAVQPSTSWSDISVKAKANFAGLAPGSTVYVFVFNDQNVTSDKGFPITVPNSSGRAPPPNAKPTAPTAVTIR